MNIQRPQRTWKGESVNCERKTKIPHCLKACTTNDLQRHLQLRIHLAHLQLSLETEWSRLRIPWMNRSCYSADKGLVWNLLLFISALRFSPSQIQETCSSINSGRLLRSFWRTCLNQPRSRLRPLGTPHIAEILAPAVTLTSTMDLPHGYRKRLGA